MPNITPTFRPTVATEFTNANVGSFYFTQNIGLVPDTVAPYLAAHNFIVNGGTLNYVDGEFAGYLLNMTRNKFSRMDAMQLLLNTMVFTYNEGIGLNQTRYEDLVTNLQDLLSNNQADISSFLSTKVENNVGYVTLLIAGADSLETDHTTFATELMALDTGDRAAALTALKTAWEAASTAAEAEYATMTAGLDIPDLLDDMEDALTSMDTALTTFFTNHAALATTLASEYATHAAAATAFLTSLGTTELARINEHWDDAQAAGEQALADRGFYSSHITTQRRRPSGN